MAMPYDSPFVVSVPTYYDRRHLVSLPGTPWLQLRPVPSAVWPVLISIGIVLVLALAAAPIVAGGLLVLLLLVGGILSVQGMQRAAVQVCPACTSGMSRGSTRCPQCQFEARDV